MRWKVTSYNCQALTKMRPLAAVLAALAGHIIALQGTRLAPKVDPLSRPQVRRTAWHETENRFTVWHWTRQQESGPDDPRGVSKLRWIRHDSRQRA